MPRMRLMVEAFNEIKANDPDTSLTLCALKRLVKAGEIPSVNIGRKKLINYDTLISYLSTQNAS